MLSRRENHKPHRAFPALSLTLLFLCILKERSATPLPVGAEEYQDVVLKNSTIDPSVENSTDSDLYVIRAVVYEIGVLTDADNTTDETTERHEEVNISFYSPSHEKDVYLNGNQTSTFVAYTIDERNDTEKLEV